MAFEVTPPIPAPQGWSWVSTRCCYSDTLDYHYVRAVIRDPDGYDHMLVISEDGGELRLWHERLTETRVALWRGEWNRRKYNATRTSRAQGQPDQR